MSWVTNIEDMVRDDWWSVAVPVSVYNALDGVENDPLRELWIELNRISGWVPKETVRLLISSETERWCISAPECMSVKGIPLELLLQTNCGMRIQQIRLLSEKTIEWSDNTTCMELGDLSMLFLIDKSKIFT